MLKMAALAPMPRASVRTTVTARPLTRVSERNVNFRSVIIRICPELGRQRNILAKHWTRAAVISLLKHDARAVADHLGVRKRTNGGRFRKSFIISDTCGRRERRHV